MNSLELEVLLRVSQEGSNALKTTAFLELCPRGTRCELRPIPPFTSVHFFCIVREGVALKVPSHLVGGLMLAFSFPFHTII